MPHPILLALLLSGSHQEVPKLAKGVNPARVRTADPDWQFAEKEVYASQSLLANRLNALTPGEISRHVLHKGSSASKVVALTFDDGPHPDFTPKLLAILKRENVKATFFVIGFMADKYPDLIRQIAADGHEVANHSYSHATLSRLPRNQVITDLLADNDIIFRLTGKTARYFRPPGGDFSRATLRAALSLGLTTVLWTDDPGDYNNPGDAVLMHREIAALTPGAIILLHDGSPNTVDTLSAFIRRVKGRGMQFTSLAKLK